MNAPTFVYPQRTALIRTLFAAGVLAFSTTVASAASDEDVRAVFDQFVKAQNSHDIVAVRELLLDSPNFLWVTRGAPVWGARRRSSGSNPCTRAPGNSRPIWRT